MICGYCHCPIVGEPVEVLDAMPGEPELACQPCFARHRLNAPADPGPGSPCPYCDEASVVDEVGACVHCGVLRPCSNCGGMDHAFLSCDDDGAWNEDCEYQSAHNEDGTRRSIARRG